MRSNRRNFLLSGPAALFAYEGFAELAEAQGGTGKPNLDVTDFWANGMGVPPTRLLGGVELGTRGGRQQAGPTTSANFAREPIFLYYDADENALIPASEIPGNKLSANGDSKVDFRLTRMRLNGDDDKTFQSFTSGGIYFDMSQQEAATASSSAPSWISAVATPIFAALFPSKPAGGGKGSSGGKSSSGNSKKPGLNFLPQQTAAAAAGGSSGAPAATIPMQPKLSQSIVLTSGMGKTAFSAFAKGRRKTAFGSFLDAMLSITQAASPFLPILNLPVVGTASLSEIRGFVGNLQNHGGDQQAILQSPPLDLATTANALQQLEGALKLRTGQYIAIPQEHAAAMKEQMAKVKLLNGFLVPKEATEMDVFTTVPTTAPNVSYLSLQVGVNPAPTKKG